MTEIESMTHDNAKKPMTNERIEKSWSSVLIAARTHHNALVDEGVVNEDRVRLTVAARREEAAVLTKPVAEGGKGLSQRQAAKVLGVDAATVNRDLLQNAPKSVAKCNDVPPQICVG